jgi:hypothetical protein
MTEQNPDANAVDTQETDISIFTPAALREAPKEETGDEPEDAIPVAADAGETGDDAGRDDDSGAEDSEEVEKLNKSKRTTAERINKLTADRRYWEREALAQRTRLQQIEAELAAAKAAKEDPLTPVAEGNRDPTVQGPDPRNYRYGELDPQYFSDLADFRAEQKIQALLQKQEEAQRAAAAEQHLAQVREKAAQITEIGQAKFSDFDTVVVEAARNGEFPLTQEMFETAAETKVAAEILYYLAQNPVEAARVADMNPRQQALWFGRKEAEMSQPARPKPKIVSSAPDPISPARGSTGQFSTSAATADFLAFEKMANSKG